MGETRFSFFNKTEKKNNIKLNSMAEKKNEKR